MKTSFLFVGELTLLTSNKSIKHELDADIHALVDFRVLHPLWIRMSL